MRQSRLFVSLIVVAGMSCAAWGQNPPAQQGTPPPATPPSSATQQQTPPPAPSLADVARKYREEKAEKEKNGAPPATVYSNEGALPKGGVNTPGKAPASSSPKSGKSAAEATPAPAAAQGFEGRIAALDDALGKINALAGLDRASLVKTILKENNIDFPGRAEWEERLMVGRNTYVTHARQLNGAMKQLLLQAKALHDANPNIKDDDPRVQSIMNNANEVSRESEATGDEFEQLMDEGSARAKQAKVPGD